MAFNVKTFYTRATTALVFVALLLGCVWYSYYSFIIFFTVVGFIGLYEFNKIAEKLNARPNSFIGYLFLFLISVYFLIMKVDDIYGYHTPLTLYKWCIRFTPFIIFPSLFIIELFKRESSMLNIGYLMISIIYILIPIFCLGLMYYDGYQIILGMIFFVWINDTGAYFVGSFFGKHKLYEKISPNKTWEGTLGGIAFCIGLSFVVANMFPQLATIHWVAISIIVAVFGTLGDLVESMLKRMAGVKDSGSLMPGHGGVLDRFDSLFFATPFVFCYLALMGLL